MHYMKVAFAIGGYCPVTWQARQWNIAAVRAIVSRFPECRVEIYVQDRNRCAELPLPAVMPGVQIYSPERYAARNCPVLWKRWLAGMISRNRPDLLHGTSDIFSDRLLKDFPDLKCVVTVHDFSFLSVRTGFSWIQRHRYNIMLRRSCRRAALVVSLDESDAADTVKYYFIPMDRILVGGDCPSSSGGGPAAGKIMAAYESLLQDSGVSC